MVLGLRHMRSQSGLVRQAAMEADRDHPNIISYDVILGVAVWSGASCRTYSYLYLFVGS